MRRIEHSAVGAPAQETCHGRVQVHTCVSVHCDQCGDALGGPEFPAHYPTKDAALDAAAAQGWRISPGGRLWCSACGPVLTCAADGHEFTPWQAVLNGVDEFPEPLAGTEHTAASAAGHPLSREYRYCRRCCLHESHRDRVLINGLRGHGKRESALLATADVSGEVA
jgi:hypothetical protein